MVVKRVLGHIKRKGRAGVEDKNEGRKSWYGEDIKAETCLLQIPKESQFRFEEIKKTQLEKVRMCSDEAMGLVRAETSKV